MKTGKNIRFFEFLRLPVSINRLSAIILMAIVMGSVMAIAMKSTRAETEREDQEYEKEDTGHESGKEDTKREDSEREIESEDPEKETEHDGDWDLSDDFNQERAPAAIKTEDTNIIKKNARQEDSLNASVQNQGLNAPRNITIPELNTTPYRDDDNDTIINKEDRYPGQNDLLYVDSDSDGIKDAFDKYRGKNDQDFEDNDRDGVVDSNDSNIGKDTDIDHDGIDDAFDKRDDRPLMVRLLTFLGIMR